MVFSSSRSAAIRSTHNWGERLVNHSCNIIYDVTWKTNINVVTEVTEIHNTIFVNSVI
jgi:hypothetical protein